MGTEDLREVCVLGSMRSKEIVTGRVSAIEEGHLDYRLQYGVSELELDEYRRLPQYHDIEHLLDKLPKLYTEANLSGTASLG